MIDAEWLEEKQGIYRTPGGWYKTCTRVTSADVARMWKRLWGEVAEPVIPSDWGRTEDGELLDLCEGLQINQKG